MFLCVSVPLVLIGLGILVWDQRLDVLVLWYLFIFKPKCTNLLSNGRSGRRHISCIRLQGWKVLIIETLMSLTNVATSTSLSLRSDSYFKLRWTIYDMQYPSSLVMTSLLYMVVRASPVVVIILYYFIQSSSKRLLLLRVQLWERSAEELHQSSLRPAENQIRRRSYQA